MKIQKKIVRLITFKSYIEHTELIFKELKILNIFKINDYLTALLCIDTILITYHRVLAIIL